MERPGKPKIHLLIFFLAFSITLACALPLEVPPVVAPTSAPVSLDTVIAETSVAAKAQTATALAAGTVVQNIVPTITPSPTYISAITPSDTPTDTPTFIFILASHTPTPTPINADYSCRITGQTPGSDASMSAGQDFKAQWTIFNNGINTWNTNSVDVVYLAGDKFTSSKGVDLPSIVGTGQSINITVSMTAPKATGTYKTIWGLRVGKNVFCRLVVGIVVK